MGGIAFGVVAFFGVRWPYRRLLPHYRSRWRPWLWTHFGPFDWPLLVVTLYVWIAVGYFCQVRLQPGQAIIVAWNVLSPLATIVVVHHLRLIMRAMPGAFPPWQDIPSRVVRFKRGIVDANHSRVLDLLVRTLIAVFPAMLGTTICIGGLAACPSLQFPGDTATRLMLVIWSGPALLCLAALHAWWRSWWEGDRRPRWWPLLLLGGCVLIPGLTWLAAVGPMWIGLRTEPLNGWFALLALSGALDVVLVGGRWLTRRFAIRA